MSESVYISGPMSGCVDFNRRVFDLAEIHLFASGYSVLNPGKIRLDRTAGWDEYMRAAIRMMIRADKILLLPGWGESRGAKIEKGIADGLGMPTYVIHKDDLKRFQPDWIKETPPAEATAEGN